MFNRIRRYGPLCMQHRGLFCLDALLHGDMARILALCSTGAEEAKPTRVVAVAGSKRNEALGAVGSRGLVWFGCGDRI
jgi:hypothetical protein